MSDAPRVYRAYFDASGQRGSGRALSVAGGLASVEDWSRFEEAWNQFLRLEGITPPFHMTDFISSRGQYDRFRGRDAERECVVRRAIRIIGKHVELPIAHGVFLDDLKQLCSEYHVRSVPPEPFAWCGAMAIGMVVAVTTAMEEDGAWGPNDSLEVVFEQGDTDQDVLARLAEDQWGIVPEFASKHDAVPLQVGDVLGWIMRRSLREETVPPAQRILATGIHAVLRTLPHVTLRYHDLESLRSGAEAIGLQRRDQS